MATQAIDAKIEKEARAGVGAGRERAGRLTAAGGGRAVFALCAFVLAAAAPLLLDVTTLNLLGQFLALSILAVGLDLLWGYTGILSLGQGVFFGIGGYLIAMYLKLQGLHPGLLPNFMMWSGITRLPWYWQPFHSAAFTVFAVLVIPLVVGFLLGAVIFRSRIRGVYFSIITQALAAAVATLAVDAQSVTGGSSGLTSFKSILGISFYDNAAQIGLYELTVAMLVLALILGWWLTHSHFGTLLRAIRDGENRLRFLGYNPVSFKAFVFAVGALMAGVAGALYVPQNGIIAPAMLGVVPSIEMVIWVALGGRGTLWGAVLGTLFVNIVKYFCSNHFPSVWLYLIGGLFVGVVLFFPDGLVGLLRRVRAIQGGRV